MATIDYKEKYEKAVHAAMLAKQDTESDVTVQTLEEIFPELRESEDERIRNFLIKQANSVLDSITDDDKEVPAWKSALAWLEKQGNLMKALQISNAKIGELIEKNYYLKEQLEKQGKNNMGISEATKQELEDNLNKALEKETPESCNEFLDEQSEQNPIKEHNACEFCEDRHGCVNPCSMKLIEKEKYADEIKPKFHEGDWVVYCNDDVDLITGIEENGYRINNGGYIPFICENEMRLWDITDAKVGDVLVSESTCGLGTWYCIFKSLDGDESMTVYCYLARDGRFETKKELCFDKDPYNTKPATKEQRYQLEKAMADAGYEWDAENKQLRKIEPRQKELTEFEKAVKQVMEEAIECGDTHNLKADADMLLRLVQKSTWSEEDIELLDNTIKFIEDRVAATSPSLRTYIPTLTGKEIPFLKSLKDRVQPKQEWSEEEEKMIQDIINDIAIAQEQVYCKSRCEDEINWLQSLKDRYSWKPSDEQMLAINTAINVLGKGTINGKYLIELQEQLLKLMEE